MCHLNTCQPHFSRLPRLTSPHLLAQAGTKPVMTWAAPVTAVEDKGGKKVATITVASPGRFPAPNWWAFADGYKPEYVEDGQPE